MIDVFRILGCAFLALCIALAGCARADQQAQHEAAGDARSPVAAVLRGHEIVRTGELPRDADRVERFYCDGTWEAAGGRAQLSGRFNIDGDRVCVATAAEGEQCRIVRENGSGSVSLSVGSDDWIDYTLRPLNARTDNNLGSCQ
jgi:hypothetical protein